jgi:3-methyladenine DNA glycosylase AlkD
MSSPLQLWAAGGTAACLLATLVCRPKSFAAMELDVMIRAIRAPKLLDWFVVNVVKPSRRAEQLRLTWKDGDDVMGRAGWSLTTERVANHAEGLDLEALSIKSRRSVTTSGRTIPNASRRSTL